MKLRIPRGSAAARAEALGRPRELDFFVESLLDSVGPLPPPESVPPWRAVVTPEERLWRPGEKRRDAPTERSPDRASPGTDPNSAA